MRTHRRPTWLTTLLLVLLGTLPASCAFLRPATVPLRVVRHPAPQGPATGLVVMLPGIFGTPEDFERHGCVARVQELRPDFDVVTVDAHFGYYRERTIVERLEQDVLADADDYEHVWLVGISMGGLGAPLYTREHPEHIEGMILLAPFMGSYGAIDAVVKAGGLHRWTPPDDLDAQDPDDIWDVLWGFYRGYVTRPDEMPKLYVGRGFRDRLNWPNSLVAQHLPPLQNRVIQGAHNWTTWRPLFDELAARAFPAAADAVTDHPAASTR